MSPHHPSLETRAQRAPEPCQPHPKRRAPRPATSLRSVLLTCTLGSAAGADVAPLPPWPPAVSLLLCLLFLAFLMGLFGLFVFLVKPPREP